MVKRSPQHSEETRAPQGTERDKLDPNKIGASIVSPPIRSWLIMSHLANLSSISWRRLQAASWVDCMAKTIAKR